MAIPADTPLTFDLPDGQIQLCSWAYVASRLSTELVSPIKDILDLENVYLEQIETKLQSWVDEQE